MAEMPEVLTMAEAAKYLRIHQATLKRWMQQRIAPASRIGGRVLFRKAALDRVLEAHEGSPQPAAKGEAEARHS
jgi:excisionase family DNA binding protein